MSETNNTNTIIIDLNSSQELTDGNLSQKKKLEDITKALEDITNDIHSSQKLANGNLIQKKALENITNQIIHRLNDTDSIGSQVFFIDGTRGAGKSTFIKSVSDKLVNETGIKLLIALDPSKIATGEHIFVSILQAVNKQINENHCKVGYDESEYEKWRKQLKKLAGGLQLLDENKNPLQDIDGEAFLNLSMERAESGAALANGFTTLIKYSCKLLKINALLITIDDADTNFTKGQQLLEVIRCYLDSPQLVTLITGDLQLYSHLVRDLFYKNMGTHALSHDKSRNLEQIKMVDHLEDQYLKKLFPLEQRTYLTPLWDLLQHDTEYLIKYKNNKMEVKCEKLDKIIDDLLKDGLSIKDDGRDISLYKEFLLKQPLRSIIQLLTFCTKNMHENKFQPEHVAVGFRAMFLGNLHNHQVDVNALRAGDINALNEAVFRLVLEDGEFDTGCYLRPQPIKESLRNCFVALAADVAKHCYGRPDYAIDFMLQAQGSIALYNLIANDPLNKQDDKHKQQQFKSYFSIGRNENALNWARHATGILALALNNQDGDNNRTIIGIGVIGLERSDNLNSIENHTIFALSRVNITDGENKTYASIFNILGLIVNFISLHESSLKEENSLKDIITNQLKKHEYISTISGYLQEDGINYSKNNNQNKNKTNFQSLSENLELWLKNIVKNEKNKIKPSSIFLGKVWARLYFSLLGVLNINTGVADLMQNFAICVINAFLVEEAYYHIGHKSSNNIDRNNPKDINQFGDKIKEVDIKEYPLTYIIASCPLILGLINENDKEKITFSTIYKNDIFCKKTDFNAVNEIQYITPNTKVNSSSENEISAKAKLFGLFNKNPFNINLKIKIS